MDQRRPVLLQDCATGGVVDEAARGDRCVGGYPQRARQDRDGLDEAAIAEPALVEQVHHTRRTTAADDDLHLLVQGTVGDRVRADDLIQDVSEESAQARVAECAERAPDASGAWFILKTVVMSESLSDGMDKRLCWHRRQGTKALV